MNTVDAQKARLAFKKWLESKGSSTTRERTTRERVDDALWGAYLYGYMAGLRDADSASRERT